jgi:hypothetical protein
MGSCSNAANSWSSNSESNCPTRIIRDLGECVWLRFACIVDIVGRASFQAPPHAVLTDMLLDDESREQEPEPML